MAAGGTSHIACIVWMECDFDLNAVVVIVATGFAVDCL